MEKIFGEFVTIGIGEMLLQIFIFCFIEIYRFKERESRSRDMLLFWRNSLEKIFRAKEFIYRLITSYGKRTFFSGL